MGAYFRLNYRQEPASKWPELKAKFFKFLIDHHSEWKSIRNNNPLGYLPYMEAQFERVTGYKLVGLGACTEWIRAGTYYHWVIAQQGQLGRCPRLAGIPLPQGPMTPPPYPPVTAVCSLLVIPPPPPGQEALPGGVPEDLSQDNLSTWADIVQDVVAGMIAPPARDEPDNLPTGSRGSDTPRVGVTGGILSPVLPAGSACRCLGSCSTTSTASTTGPLWSDIADPTFGTSSAPAGRGAGSALPYGSSAMAGGSIWDLPSADFPRLPGAPSAIRQPCPPAGRASHLESQLMAIRYGMTAPPDPLRLPQPTWRPPTTQNCRWVQLPPPPPRTDSASTTDQSQQTTAPDLEPEGPGTQRPG